MPTTATKKRKQQSNQAMFFDGVDDSIDIGRLLFSGDDATVAFWAQSAGTQSGITALVSQGHWGGPVDTGFAFQFAYPSSQVTNLIYGNGAGAAHSWHLLSLDIDLEIDTDWHHYAFTKNRNAITSYRDDLFVYDHTLSGSEIQNLASIPEPSSLVVFGLAGSALMMRRKRKRLNVL